MIKSLTYNLLYSSHLQLSNPPPILPFFHLYEVLNPFQVSCFYFLEYRMIFQGSNRLLLAIIQSKHKSIDSGTTISPSLSYCLNTRVQVAYNHLPLAIIHKDIDSGATISPSLLYTRVQLAVQPSPHRFHTLGYRQRRNRLLLAIIQPKRKDIDSQQSNCLLLALIQSKHKGLYRLRCMNRKVLQSDSFSIVSYIQTISKSLVMRNRK